MIVLLSPLSFLILDIFKMSKFKSHKSKLSTFYAINEHNFYKNFLVNYELGWLNVEARVKSCFTFKSDKCCNT